MGNARAKPALSEPAARDDAFSLEYRAPTVGPDTQYALKQAESVTGEMESLGQSPLSWLLPHFGSENEDWERLRPKSIAEVLKDPKAYVEEAKPSKWSYVPYAAPICVVAAVALRGGRGPFHSIGDIPGSYFKKQRFLYGDVRLIVDGRTVRFVHKPSLKRAADQVQRRFRASDAIAQTRNLLREAQGRPRERLPSGPWLAAARDFSVKNGLLTAELQRDDGTWQVAQIQVTPGVPLRNSDGKFVPITYNPEVLQIAAEKRESAIDKQNHQLPELVIPSAVAQQAPRAAPNSIPVRIAGVEVPQDLDDDVLIEGEPLTKAAWRKLNELCDVSAKEFGKLESFFKPQYAFRIKILGITQEEGDVEPHLVAVLYRWNIANLKWEMVADPHIRSGLVTFRPILGNIDRTGDNWRLSSAQAAAQAGRQGLWLYVLGDHLGNPIEGLLEYSKQRAEFDRAMSKQLVPSLPA
eukprot:TRINITY_DN43611_c0_g1_i1.p1 TRINITY_DN43611_c0_g1~~TRINITY_DN43611_c0_g1_i1.p1  ORF type:complete len:466 (+),score=52.20 TRINITY_DN43611_c0_g1_i1:21-1418(+)